MPNNRVKDQKETKLAKYMYRYSHYYGTGLYFRPFAPAVFGPGTKSLSRLPLGLGQKVAFVPGPTASRASGGTWAFCPGWRHQLGQNGLGPLIPFPLPPPEPFSSLVFLLFLAQDRGVLAHFFTTFMKIFDSPSIHRR